MNYLKELDAFHIKQETNPLTISAVYLWFLLMDENNKTGWRKKFTVTASLLRLKATLPNTTFKRARLELEKKGYIRFESRGRNRAAVYEMISLVNSEEVNSNSTD